MRHFLKREIAFGPAEDYFTVERRANVQRAMNRPNALYYLGQENRCVCCGKSNWDVGRVVAQCMFCDSGFDIVTVKRA